MSSPVRWLACAVVMLCVSQRADAQTTIFRDDFESGTTQWSMKVEWHLSGPDLGLCNVSPFPSGAWTARFGTKGRCYFGAYKGRMISAKPISIPADAQAARLRFDSFEATECGFGNCAWDERYVYVSSNGGQTWYQVWKGGKEWLWIEKSVELTDFVGQDVLIAFEFDPVDGWDNDHPGWLVDDVKLEIDEPGGPVVYCNWKENSLGCAALMSYAGSPSASGPGDLVLSCSNLRNQVWGRFAWSLASASTPFSGGTLCVQLPAVRTLVANSGGSPATAADCSGSYAWHFSHAYLAVHGLGPGTTFFTQYIGRDFGPGINFQRTLSNAVAVTILP